MVLGVGIDLLDTRRMARALERTPGIADRVFTAGERRECEGRFDRAERLAARFAAKEACLKALGTGWSGGVTFSQVEVVRTESGQPSIVLSGAAADRAKAMGVRGVLVSLTHERGVAGAVVILEGDPSRGGGPHGTAD